MALNTFRLQIALVAVALMALLVSEGCQSSSNNNRRCYLHRSSNCMVFPSAARREEKPRVVIGLKASHHPQRFKRKWVGSPLQCRWDGQRNGVHSA